MPSERELDVLKALWELGSGSVREVHERMCPGGELAFNTVQTVLRIMEEKGLVRHRAVGRTFIYEPVYSRDRVASRLLHRVFDGALDQVVLSLLQAKDAQRGRAEGPGAADRRGAEAEGGQAAGKARPGTEHEEGK